MKALVIIFVVFSVTAASAYEEVTEFDRPVAVEFSSNEKLDPQIFSSTVQRQSWEPHSSWIDQTLEAPAIVGYTAQGDKRIIDHFKVRLNGPTMNFELLWKLNEGAISTWDEFLNCSGNDLKAARDLYRDALAKKCPKAFEKLSRLRGDIWNITLTMDINDFDFSELLDCSIDPLGNCAIVATALKRTEQTFRVYGAVDSNMFMTWPFKGVVEFVKRPLLHPLLVQLLLEQMATDNQFAFAGYDVLDYSFMRKSSKIVIEPYMRNWGIWVKSLVPRRQDWDKMRDFQHQMGRYFREGSTEMGPQDQNSEIFLRLRRTYAAFRILRVLQLSQAKCQEFGLWPEATQRLIHAMATTGQLREQQRGEFQFYSPPLMMLAHMNAVCSPEPKYFSISSSVAFGFSSDSTGSVAAAARSLAGVGAWRALREKQR